MKIENCFINVLLFYQILFCYGQNSFFRLEREDKELDTNINPILNETFESRTFCFMKCLTLDQCCYVQIKQLIDKWFCSLFPSFINSNDSKKEAKSDIFSVVDGEKCSRKDIVDLKIKKECLDWYELGFKTNGVYDIVVNQTVKKVFCDMTNEGGGWTILQRRIDGSVNFQRTWNEYKNGFGNINGEYWLGNELIYQMTNRTRNSLIRIKGTSFKGITKYIIFKWFRIENEANKFKLHTGVVEVDEYGLGNNWLYQDQMFFTTLDSDNDSHSTTNCAVYFGGGWWHKSCFRLSPNNHYSSIENVTHARGISWYDWTTHATALKRISIAIKRQ